jgi:diguanylate cyclase (GGDEF)-like protein
MNEPGEHGAPRRQRWQRVGQRLLVLAVVGATAGIIGIVVQNAMLLGRMTTGVSTAQERATNVHNLQRETLRLLQQVTELKNDGDVEAVAVRRGLLGQQFRVVTLLFPGGSQQARELAELHHALDIFPWAELAGSSKDVAVLQASAMAFVSQVEVRIKNLSDEQEKYFYDATLRSLEAKRDSENALALLVSLVVVLAVCWLVLLKRRTRSRLALAYDALVSEVAERRALQDRLTHQAFHDALTGLPNRALFLRRLEEAVQAATREPEACVSAVLIDLDGFKNVNDTLGHPAGDELLQRVAERLRGCTLDGDTVARLGGDEFAIVIPSGRLSDATSVSRRVIDAVRMPIRVAGQEVTVTASIGVAHLTSQQGAEDLLCDADIAMYAAKRGGKARYEVFEQGMRDRTSHRARLEQRLARAVELGEIEVHYQPILDLGTGRVRALEALARWHSENELIPPAVFIPVAEESGLIGEIGRDVLRQACRTVQRWRQSLPGSEDLCVTVNVSVRQLLSGEFSTHLTEALAESGLPSSGLTLEITESMLLEDSETVAAELVRIRALGVRLAMDDFGAGYSSLASLLRFQVQMLKIDRTFLDMDTTNGGSLVRAVADLGRSLQLTVVAEGVETAEQLAQACAAGCDAAQGYYLSRPMPEADARRYLERAAAGDIGLLPTAPLPTLLPL